MLPLPGSYPIFVVSGHTETSKNQRVNSFPSMAVDISGGPNNGNIYIVWANVGVPGVNTGSDIDVYMIRSTDEGSAGHHPSALTRIRPGLEMSIISPGSPAIR